jgi:hypothetical protein
MSYEAFFARCGELLGRWTTAFTEGLRRGREPQAIPRRIAATSDPELHPY